MVRPEIKDATRLRRTESVSPQERTSEREALADWIEANVVDGDRDWQDWTLTEIAEAYGCSRQHVANTVDAYFEPAGRPSRGEFIDAVADGAADIDDRYQAVFAAGFKEGVQFAREHPELFE